VADDGAAQRAGLRSGDVLLAINGQEIDAPNQFQSAIALRRPDDDISLGVWRRGERRDFEARLIGREDAALQSWVAEINGRNPDFPAVPETRPPNPFHGDLDLYELEAWGVGLRDLTDEEREAFGVESGVYVAFVRQGGAASADGLPAGTALTEIEGEPVDSAEGATAVLDRISEAGETALVRVLRSDGVAAYYDLESPAYAEQ
jgi:serine protease Do